MPQPASAREAEAAEGPGILQPSNQPRQPTYLGNLASFIGRQFMVLLYALR